MAADGEYWSRIGRNSKNRGRSFERRVAGFLGWTRVPYSGGQTGWGKGDVVDGFYSRDGFWQAECKSQSAGNISIREKWLQQMEKMAATHPTRLPIIITATKGAPIKDAVVVLPEHSWDVLYEQAGGELEPDLALVTKTTSKGRGFCVRSRWLTPHWRVAIVSVMQRDGTVAVWRLMRLPFFKDTIESIGMSRREVEEHAPDEE